MTPQNKAHPTWDRPAEFVFTLLGYVVGAGNLWRFSHLCFKNGGGAFLIPYVITAIFIALPLYLFEVALGQFSQRARLGAWNRIPLMKGLGYASFVVSCLCMLPFMGVMAWVILFLVHSFTTGPLPWSTCDNAWNTDSCTIHVNITNQSQFLQDSLPQVQFWRNHVLRLANGNLYNQTFNWQMLLCLVAAFVTTFAVTLKGIRTSGKVVYVTVTAPYVILIAFFIRAATLEGSGNGMMKLLIPDFKRLLAPRVWVEAATQVLYSLGVCFVGLTAFGSYNPRNFNFYRQSIAIIPAGCLTSIFMGLTTFGFLGHIAHAHHVDIDYVMSSGPGLVFQVYPYALGLMPAPQLWSALFFIMFYAICIDSAFGEFEGIIAVLGDAFPNLTSTTRNRMWTSAIFGFIFFLISLTLLTQEGLYIFELLNNYAGSGISLLSMAFFESIAVGWMWNADEFSKDCKSLTGTRPSAYFKICYRFVIPIATAAIVIFFCAKWTPLTVGNYVYPGWANGIGWILSLVPILATPCVAVYVMMKGEGTLVQRFKMGIKWRNDVKDKEVAEELAELKA